MDDANDALRLDYEQTTQLMRSLTDIRFKLLAFVPTVAGAAVGFLGSGHSDAELLAVGLLGLVATLGVLLYEVRNSELYDSIIERAVELEEKLGLGLLSRRPQKRATLFGMVRRATSGASASSTARRSPAGRTSLCGERFAGST